MDVNFRPVEALKLGLQGSEESPASEAPAPPARNEASGIDLVLALALKEKLERKKQFFQGMLSKVGSSANAAARARIGAVGSG